MAFGNSVGTSIAIGVAFELAAHVFVHYTIPGAQFASWLAQSIAPALDSAGITTVFAESAKGPSYAAVEALPSLDALGAG